MPNNSAENPPESLTQSIHSMYRRLPERERRVADLILLHPPDLATQTATEVAQRAEVSNATVTRFFRRLGFESFDSARKAARQLRANGSPLYTSLSKGAESEFLSMVLREEIAALESTLSSVNPVTLREIAEAIIKVKRVRVVGFRNSHALAQYIAAVLSQLRPDVSLIPAPAQSMSEDLAQLCLGDMVIFVGLRRRPASFNSYVKAVAETGADVLLIADDSVRVAPFHATWTLTCIVKSNQVFDTYVGAMALLRALVLSVAKRLPKERRKHLERVEAFHDVLSDLE